MRTFLTDALKLGVTAVVLATGVSKAMAACGPETTLAPSKDYSFTFKVCDSSLFGTVTARATGWVAVGFSSDQYMPATDVFMAGVLTDGTSYSQDAFAFRRVAPTPDPRQDVQLLSASELDGVTSFSFSRLLNTGDASRDYDLTSGPYYILTAFNLSSDNLSEQHSYADSSAYTYQFAPVPEPQAVLMLLAGLGLVAGRLRRVRSVSAA
ncbi:DOMON domain-containing protein [Roseateles sp.]|uniref:DOMON domain-containing protein n=1 Tax=Roseateles sp. TaxID=1971397 RepID=UPI003BA628F7